MKIFKKLFRFLKRMSSLTHKINRIQEALGRIEQRQITQYGVGINDAEFRVFSQWGEDGIIQYLINHVPIERKLFIEFGVENYTESNTRFLLTNNYWSGLVLDGSEENIAYIKKDTVYWGYNLKAEHAFITKDNINDLIMRNGIRGDIGLLSVDIDGNDYWVWEAIDCISPRIVISEYNSLFGPIAKVTTPYDPAFVRDLAHFSKVYYGSSITALDHLAKQKGYSLVGANTAGNNVFFVRNDLLGTLKVHTPEAAYRQAQFREYHNESGELTYDDFATRLRMIEDLEIYNIETQSIIKIKDIKAIN
ncbi:MAG: NADH dehydrogenase subunit [Geobacteraceae bacterium]|nr:MAG: NADH dehydrogenase subunit [Geobacteraceae bacterium]